MMKLSRAAVADLINAGTSRQGAKVAPTYLGTESELRVAGLIGEDCGLTRKGSIERERLMNAMLDRAFG